MSIKLTNIHLAALACGGLLFMGNASLAQVAGGTTTVGVSVTESTQLAMGWSVKKTLMARIFTTKPAIRSAR